MAWLLAILTSILAISTGLGINFAICYGLNRRLPEKPIWLLALLSSLISMLITIAIAGFFFLRMVSEGCGESCMATALFILFFLIVALVIGALKDGIASWLILRFVIRRKSRTVS